MVAALFQKLKCFRLTLFLFDIFEDNFLNEKNGDCREDAYRQLSLTEYNHDRMRALKMR